jgi:TolB-like protein
MTNIKPFRITALVLCLCALILPSPAQELDKELPTLAAKLATLIKENGKKKVTVLDFTDLQGNGSELGRYIAEELSVNLVMNKRDFSVLDRANLKSILSEHKLTATGLVDPANAKKLGQFAGVDAIIIGTITPKNPNTSLTAKIITTDTAEIVGAAKAEFKPDETTQQLSSRPAAANTSGGQSGQTDKPFGDMQARVESLRLLPQTSPGFNVVKLTLVITNASLTQTYGVGLEPDFYNKFNLSNTRGDEFKAAEVTGIETIFDRNDGRYQGSLTRLPPKSSVTIVAKTQFVAHGKFDDYRPYRLQTVVIWGVEQSRDRYTNPQKYNLVLDIN